MHSKTKTACSDASPGTSTPYACGMMRPCEQPFKMKGQPLTKDLILSPHTPPALPPPRKQLGKHLLLSRPLFSPSQKTFTPSAPSFMISWNTRDPWEHAASAVSTSHASATGAAKVSPHLLLYTLNSVHFACKSSENQCPTLESVPRRGTAAGDSLMTWNHTLDSENRLHCPNVYCVQHGIYGKLQ